MGVLCLVRVACGAFPPFPYAYAQSAFERFASLRSSEVRLREGPGVTHAAIWEYLHSGLPVRILKQNAAWAHVRDWDGVEGWLPRSVLSARRTAIVTAEGSNAQLYREADDDSEVVAEVENSVVVVLQLCRMSWCRVSASGFEGWLAKADMWGVEADEVWP